MFFESQVTKIKGLKKKSILKKKISEEEVIKLVAKRPLMVELKAYDSLHGNLNVYMIYIYIYSSE